MNIKIKKLDDRAVVPNFATQGAACFDLHCVLPEDKIVQFGWSSLDEEFEAAVPEYVFNTGLAFEIPPDFAMLIFSRSGHGFNKGIRLANCVGVIDSDYRGEVKVKLYQEFAEHGFIKFKHGDRIAQAMIIPVYNSSYTCFEVVDELSNTDRGEGGFGSTGQ